MKLSTVAGGISCLVVFALPSSVDAAPCASDDTREVCIERDIYFLPGVHGIFLAPRGADDPFLGGGVQIAPFHWSHNNDRFGPSQGAVFLGASMLESGSSDAAMAIYDAGFSLSFERNASRRFLIPYFGTSFGGTIHRDLPNTAFAYPFAGIHFYWHHNLVLDGEGGYHFPFASIDEMSGPRAQMTARFSMW